jgi:hypothetical protein
MAISSDECDDLKTIYKITILCYTLEIPKQIIKHTHSPLIRKRMVCSRLEVFFSVYILVLIDRIIAGSITLLPHSSSVPNNHDKKNIRINKKIVL